MSFLRLEGVSKYYGSVGAVMGFDLEVERGEFVSLLGPSGCGKTTTLQMIAGFVPVTSGRIDLDGRDITHAAPNSRGLGIVFQSYALFPHMTVFDNVSFGLEMRRVPKVERRARVMEALGLVHLDGFEDRYPRQLSGGQRQRVALARALVIKPPVLLLDEPLSNLDAKLREEMQFELRQIQRTVGTTTIMVTHDQAEALSISDRVVVMEAGRITQTDQPYRVYEHPRTGFISKFVGKTNLLPAVVENSDQVVVSGLAVPVDTQGHARGAPVTLCLRPEKLTLTRAGQGRIDGTVARRYFLGSQWLYYIDSRLGEILVAAPNTGEEPVAERAEIGIDWPAGVTRLIAAEELAHVRG